jgi:2-dehydro-3-deoxyphosphogluconate aldolase/(4S)-4-hydroxy-2-oxoglutarate aldolase
MKPSPESASPAFPRSLQSRVESRGIVAVLVIDDAARAVPLARALLAGGVDIMELTLRTPAALDALRAIRSSVPEMLAGVGTVLGPAQLSEAADAGAAFCVAPGFNPRVVSAARDAGIPFIPGVMTPSDIEGAVALGCRLLKFFPAETSGGIRHLTAMAAPYAHLDLRYIPLGGLNAANAPAYFKSPLVAAIGGSWIADRALVGACDWEGVRRNAAEAVALHKASRAPSAGA